MVVSSFLGRHGENHFGGINGMVPEQGLNRMFCRLWQNIRAGKNRKVKMIYKGNNRVESVLIPAFFRYSPFIGTIILSLLVVYSFI